MHPSPKLAISTAKFKQKALIIDTNTSQFDTTQTIIQEMYTQIDSLIHSITTKVIKNTSNSNPLHQNQLNMLKADEESTNLQSYYLAIEIEELQNALEQYSQHETYTQIQVKKSLNSCLQQINNCKQDILKYEQQYKENEKSLQQLTENQQKYAQILIKLKEKQQISDSVHKLLDSTGQSQWLKLRQIFEVDIIKTQIPLETISILQKILIQESENLIQSNKHQFTQQQKKQLLMEIQCQHPLINIILSFDQLILNIVHQPKDKQLSKQGLLVQIVKCLTILNQNFNQINEQLIKGHFSQNNFEKQQKDIIQLNNQLKIISQQKSQLLIEGDKLKKQQKSQQQQLIQLQEQQKRKIDHEVSNLLQSYLQDKDQVMREIKFKYGKQYHDHMLLDVKQEFKKICINNMNDQQNALENVENRIEEIKLQTLKNKDKIIELHKIWKDTKLIEINTQTSPIDEKEFLLQLQNLKIVLLQLENRISKKIAINPECLLNELQIEINKLKNVIDSNFIRCRSDSIDAFRKTKPSIHGRSQSQVPIISTQASEIKFTIQNAQELFDSSEDPIQIVKKPFSDQSSYQLSFNQNPLKSLSGIQEQSLKESSLHNSILEAIQSNRNKRPEVVCFLQLSDEQQMYDPTKNQDPTLFGFKLVKIDSQFNIYSIEEKENNRLLKKLEVKQLYLDQISQTALRFKQIYEPSMRAICQDSMALRHLNMKYFPFILEGQEIIHGLCLNEQDLIKLQLLFKL